MDSLSLSVDQFAEVLSQESEWYDLGVFLGASTSDLKEIDQNYARNGTRRCLIELYGCLEKKGRPLSWETIAIALRRMSNNSLADKIHSKRILPFVRNISSVSICQEEESSTDQQQHHQPVAIDRPPSDNYVKASDHVASMIIKDSRVEEICGEFQSLTERFVFLTSKMKRSLKAELKSSIDLEELQDLIEDLCGLASLPQDQATFEAVFKRLKQQCSILNFRALVVLVENLLTNEENLQKELAKFTESVESFKKSAKMIELASLINNNQIVPHGDKKVKLKVREFWNQFTMKQFETVMNEILDTLYDKLSHITVGKGCICVSWEIPEHINASKLVPELSLEFVQIIGVISLHIGDTVIYEIGGKGCETIEAAMLQAIELKNTRAVELLLAVGCSPEVATYHEDNVSVTTIVNIRDKPCDSNGVHHVCVLGSKPECSSSRLESLQEEIVAIPIIVKQEEEGFGTQMGQLRSGIRTDSGLGIDTGIGTTDSRMGRLKLGRTGIGLGTGPVTRLGRSGLGTSLGTDLGTGRKSGVDKPFRQLSMTTRLSMGIGRSLGLTQIGQLGHNVRLDSGLGMDSSIGITDSRHSKISGTGMLGLGTGMGMQGMKMKRSGLGMISHNPAELQHQIHIRSPFGDSPLQNTISKVIGTAVLPRQRLGIGAEMKVKVTARDRSGTILINGGSTVRATLTCNEEECPVTDNGDGTYLVSVIPQKLGQHQLYITVNGQYIQDRPYTLDIVPQRDYTKLKGPVQTITGITSPSHIAFSDNGDMFVTSGDHCIHVYDMKGNKKATIGSYGSGELQFQRPRGIDINGKKVYVAEYDGHRIHILTTEGEFIVTFGGKDSCGRQLHRPTDVKVGPDGKVYVVDSGNHCVQVFNLVDLTVSHVIDGRVSGDGGFLYPRGVAFDLSDDVHVTNDVYSSVTVFTPNGKFIREYKINAISSEGIAVDPSGYSIITTRCHNSGSMDSLSVYDPIGKHIHSVTGLINPSGVSVSPDGSLWVADTGNDRLVQYCT